MSNLLSKVTSRLRGEIYKYFMFKSTGRFSILKPVRIIGLKCIKISHNVHISKNAWIEAYTKNISEPSLVIDKNTTIADFAHIIATENIHIKSNVLIASKVFITDSSHEYRDVSKPIKEQGIISIGHVVIGENSWVGENVCIMGCNIGCHCIIGANSVVTKDVPDYSIAVGIPAKVIKSYNFESRKWEKIC